MSKILDDEISTEADILEAQGHFGLARMLRDTSEVNLESLASMANVPARFMRFLVNSPIYQQLMLQHEARDKEERNRQDRIHEFANRLAEIHQREIDNNKLTLSVNGKDIEISQGDLRKIMQRRVDELKERQLALSRSGENPEELARITNLIQAYEPVIDETKKGKADAETMADIQELMEKDPQLAAQIERHQIGHVNTKTMATETTDRRTSFSAEYFDSGTISGSSLKDKFTQGASPDSLPKPETEAPAIDEKPKQALNNVYEAVKF